MNSLCSELVYIGALSFGGESLAENFSGIYDSVMRNFERFQVLVYCMTDYDCIRIQVTHQLFLKL